MEAEPNLPASSKRMAVSLWWREERPADRSVGHAWQMAHDNIECLDGVEWNLRTFPFQRLLQRVQTRLGNELYSDVENPVASFSRQSNLQFNPLPADRKWIATVEVFAAIKNRSLSVENFLRICLDHRFHNFPINPSWAFIWLYADLVMMDETLRNFDLKVVDLQRDNPTLGSVIGA